MIELTSISVILKWFLGGLAVAGIFCLFDKRPKNVNVTNHSSFDINLNLDIKPLHIYHHND